MSNRQSKPDQLRFSGPELGDLLDRVVNEHGEEAAIAAVNRIRSGGVAGFFCREEFEVVVDPDEEVELVVEPDQDRPAADDPAKDDQTIAEVIGQKAGDRPPSRLAHRGLDRIAERHEVAGEPGSDADGDEPSVFAGPVPPGSDPGRDRFLALLERRLDETSTAEEERGLRRSRPATTKHDVDDLLAIPVAPAPAPTRTPTPAASSLPEPSTGDPRPEVIDVQARPVFWRRLDRVREELSSFVPSSSHRTAVVGPLPLASAIVHRLQLTAELASAQVVALTDRAGIVSEPSWHLERNGDRLIRALEESEDRPTIVVIDVPVDLPSWVGPLQRRLRSVGVGLFRYAVSGQPTGDDLERYRQGADVPYAIDLTSRVDPALIVELVADRHPVVSVANADLGPELLLALRRHVGGAELLFEPVIRG